MIFLLLLLLMTSPAQAFLGFDLPDPWDLVGGKPWGARGKIIEIEKGKSELALSKRDRKDLKNLLDDYELASVSELGEQLGDIVNNNFHLGTGRVDVTYQIKRGTELAMKQVLSGHSEYQRRKMVEEMLNANYRSHIVTDRFLLNVSRNSSGTPSILETIRKISKSKVIMRPHALFKNIALILVTLLTIFICFKRLGADSDWFYSISSPLFNGFWTIVMINLIGPGIDVIINLFYWMNHYLVWFLQANFWLGNNNLKLAYNWESLIEQSGYVTGLILSSVDILAQFFLYFFILALVLTVVIAKLLSPLWALALLSDSLRSNAINSFVNLLKTLVSIVLISLLYFLIRFLLREFDEMGLYFLQVSLSIAGFLYLPALSSLVLGTGQGIFSPVTGAYRNVIDSINNSYQSLRASIEQNSYNQRIENQLKVHEDLLYEKLKP
ncbi:MAG: hypothetical protein OXU45_06485 [Candidatus Melainabacteria bacterium]|nr:hypothetical protein [Candidatus Melainabacteria bacterium]